ncbi:MAG: enoyl-CoA hydratase [Frankiales bacterium]|nr:enoyl-CoA hydratase [Frankiales bacterium]
MDAVQEALGDAAGQLQVSREDGIVTVQLNRPEKHNAISYAMWSALGRLMPVLAADDEVDVVVLRGTPGGPFSAGADISEFTTLRSEPEGARAYGGAVAAGEGALIAFPKPTVAMVEGFAIGGGTQVAVACDLRVCGSTSRFGVTPAKLGIVYGMGSTARLVETVGAAWARWILLSGDLLDAEQALRIGLVHEVVEPDAVAERAYALARTLASRARISLTGGKELIARAAQGRVDEDARVQELYAHSWSSAEYAEGVAAFLAKRSPDFAAARADGHVAR